MASSLSLAPAGATRPWPVAGCAVRATLAAPLSARDQRVLPVPAIPAAAAALTRPPQPLTDAFHRDPPGVEVDDIPFCNDAAVLTDDLARPADTDTRTEPAPPPATAEVKAPVTAEPVPALPVKAAPAPESPAAPPDDPAGPWAESLRILRQPARDPAR